MPIVLVICLVRIEHY